MGATEKIKNTVNSVPDEFNVTLNLTDVNAKVEESANYMTQNWGFVPEHELDGWIESERELPLA